MGLKSDLNNGVLEMFEDDIVDILKEFVYTEETGETVAPGGIVNKTTIDHKINVLATGFSAEERRSGQVKGEEQIKKEDIKLLFPVLGTAFVPDTNGIFTNAAGREYKVVSFELDPSDSLYSVQVRA